MEKRIIDSEESSVAVGRNRRTYIETRLSQLLESMNRGNFHDERLAEVTEQ